MNENKAAIKIKGRFRTADGGSTVQAFILTGNEESDMLLFKHLRRSLLLAKEGHSK
jgi:hypothetical protein